MTLDTKFDEEEEEEELPPEVIQDSDLIKRSKCGYYYFNLKHVGMNQVPHSAYAAMSLFFQIQRKKLYMKKTKANIFVKQKIFGDSAMPYESMNAAELLENLSFRSPESYGEAMANRWLRATKDYKYQGKPINWSFDGQGHNASEIIKQAATNYYKFVLLNGAPITGFINPHPFVINIDDGAEMRKIGVRISELRAKDGKVYVDDPTIWGFNKDFPEAEKKPDMDTSSLVTLRVYAIDTLIRNNELFRLKARLDKVPQDLNYVVYRHFNASENKTIEVTRTWTDVERLKGGIRIFIARRDDATPDHRYCNGCPLNTVLISGEIACRQRKPSIKPTAPHIYFQPTRFEVDKREDGKVIYLKGYVKREISRDLVARLTVNVDLMTATINYSSEYRGLGFEARMIEAADDLLLQQPGLNAIIDYPSTFQGIGQEAAKDALVSRGFRQRGNIYQKTY